MFPLNHRLRSLILLALLAASSARGQYDDDPPISLGDSSVGYIDSALTGNQARVRFDAGYDINKPNRSEFLWGWPTGRGPALDESRADYQSITAYIERALTEDSSIFFEVPLMFSNPTVIDNTAGLGDLQIGWKKALAQTHDAVLTFQLRTHLPTGDADRTLGTGHVSLEPGLLLHRRLGEGWNWESEFRYWIPLDGEPDRQGGVLRYGAGVSRSLLLEELRITPVVEMVGWTALAGQSRFLDDSLAPVTEDAAGDTIVNLKVGARLAGVGRDELYVGYGRALTEERWYQDILRVEWRYKY